MVKKGQCTFKAAVQVDFESIMFTIYHIIIAKYMVCGVLSGGVRWGQVGMWGRRAWPCVSVCVSVNVSESLTVTGTDEYLMEPYAVFFFFLNGNIWVCLCVLFFFFWGGEGVVCLFAGVFVGVFVCLFVWLCCLLLFFSRFKQVAWNNNNGFILSLTLAAQYN